MRCQYCGSFTGEHKFSFDLDRRYKKPEPKPEWKLVWDDKAHAHYELVEAD